MSQKRQPEESDGPRRGGGADPGGSSSSSSLPHRPGETKRQRVPALRDVIAEVMWKTTIEKFFMTIEPLIRRVVKEEIESAFANHGTMMARSVTDTVPCTSKKLQLQFMAKLSLPIFTGSKIEGEGSLSITIALVDAFTQQVVASGKESLMKVEIVVLEGDFEGGEDWTAQDFDNNIVREREGKRPLISGDVFVTLTGGIGTVGELSLTDNSSWTRSRKFRLGARTEDGCFNGIRVLEAKSESFVVKDHRGECVEKAAEGRKPSLVLKEPVQTKVCGTADPNWMLPRVYSSDEGSSDDGNVKGPVMKSVSKPILINLEISEGVDELRLNQNKIDVLIDQEEVEVHDEAQIDHFSCVTKKSQVKAADTSASSAPLQDYWLRFCREQCEAGGSSSSVGCSVPRHLMGEVLVEQTSNILSFAKHVDAELRSRAALDAEMREFREKLVKQDKLLNHLGAEYNKYLDSDAAAQRRIRELTDSEAAVKEENEALKLKCSVLEKTVSDQSAAIEALTTEKDSAEEKAEAAEKRAEIAEARAISLEEHYSIARGGFEKALETVGFRCLDMQPAEGDYSDATFMNWHDQEIARLPAVLSACLENSVAVALEGLVGLLRLSDCSHIENLPELASAHGAEVISTPNQDNRRLTKRLLRKFWVAYGREETARRAREMLEASTSKARGAGGGSSSHVAAQSSGQALRDLEEAKKREGTRQPEV